MKFLKWLLFPFACLYGAIMAIRNFCYDQGIFKTEKFELPVISVGNLTIGGTGKTPHVEFLLRMLHAYKTATLSRGYKRKTKGFVLASATASAAFIGDEPFQYFLDFPETTVAVCEKRAAGIKQIVELRPQSQVVILDDAFQHRAVTPGFNILITDFYRRFDTDFMLPTGLLREPRSGARRADAVIVSKCPDTLSAKEQAEITRSLSRFTREGTPVYFTAYQYGQTVGFGSQKAGSKKVILVTGIANPAPLVQYLSENGYQILEQLQFPDHHAYTLGDLSRIAKTWEKVKDESVILLTTRKDAVKLLAPELIKPVMQLPFFYLPIEVRFLTGQARFEAQVRQLLTGHVSLI